MRLSALSLGLVTFGVATARAATDSDIPAECGARADFDAELQKRLGADAPIGSVRVSITPGPTRFRLLVQIGAEQRVLDDANCKELFRASVVIAVAMLLHDADEREPPAAPPPAPPAPREYPRFALGAGAGLNVGTLPHPVLALELQTKVLWRYWGASVNVRYLSPTEQIDDNQQGAELRALGAGVAGIFRPAPRWEARLGFAAQRLAGHGLGSKQNHDDTVWAAGPTLGLDFVAFERGPFWLGSGAEGQLSVLRGRFEILNHSQDLAGQPYPVFQVPWLSGSAFVRLGLVW